MTWPLSRGQVVSADINLDEPKLFVVVSNNRRNHSKLGSVLAVRLTTSDKPRIPSIVELGHPETFIGRAVCDDVYELFENEIVRIVGGLTGGAMDAIGDGLKAAFDLS